MRWSGVSMRPQKLSPAPSNLSRMLTLNVICRARRSHDGHMSDANKISHTAHRFKNHGHDILATGNLRTLTTCDKMACSPPSRRCACQGKGQRSSCTEPGTYGDDQCCGRHPTTTEAHFTPYGQLTSTCDLPPCAGQMSSVSERFQAANRTCPPCRCSSK